MPPEPLYTSGREFLALTEAVFLFGPFTVEEPQAASVPKSNSNRIITANR